MTGAGVGMLAIRAGRVFDGERLSSGGAMVLIDHGRIVGVESPAGPVPDGWSLADFPEASVLPGLVDTHTHLCCDSQMGALDRLCGCSDNDVVSAIEEGLRRNLAAGVTTVRDLGDRRWAVLDWRAGRDVSTANSPRPTVVASGPPITSRGGHCWFMGGEAEGADELRAAVRARAERGVDIVKVMASGGANTPGSDVMRCQFTHDEMRLVVEESHAAGLAITAHAHGVPAVEQAINAGVDGIEHCSCLSDSGIEMSEPLLEALAASGITVCPTLGIAPGVVPPPAIVDLMARTGLTHQARLEQVGRMHRAGVRLVSGADSGISAGKPHGLLPRAVVDLVTAGVPVTDALASATSLAARACGLGDRKGLLRAGYDADVLVVDGNPGDDIGSLLRVVEVMANGVLFE